MILNDFLPKAAVFTQLATVNLPAHFVSRLPLLKKRYCRQKQNKQNDIPLNGIASPQYCNTLTMVLD